MTGGVEELLVLADDLFLDFLVEDGVGEGVEDAFRADADGGPVVVFAVGEEG